MLIYVEGIDKSGKSTLAGQISSVLNIPIYRKQPPISLNLFEQHSYFKGVGFTLAELHNMFPFDAIIDRSFISDWIYTNRNDDVCSLGIWQEWEKRHIKTECIIVIYVETPTNIIEERLSKTPDPYMSKTDVARFRLLYDNYLKQTHFRVIRTSGVASTNERCDEIEAIRQATDQYIK